jgi:hypothetical protein
MIANQKAYVTTPYHSTTWAFIVYETLAWWSVWEYGVNRIFKNFNFFI